MDKDKWVIFKAEKITRGQRENWLKVANLLNRLNDHALEMNQYTSDGRLPENTCGSARCVLGWAAVVCGPALRYENWREYAERKLGISQKSETPLWVGICHSEWFWVDNSIQGAIDRIDFFLATDKVRIPMVPGPFQDFINDNTKSVELH